MAAREVSDGTRTVERWTNEGTAGYYTGNPLARQRALTTAEAADLAAMDAGNTQASNRSTLTDRATTALTTNVAFLGLASPTNAQTLAQVQTLTKECSALIRLLLNQLDSIVGS